MLDLTGRTPDDRGHRPFTDVLAEKAADGVDVRVVLSAAEFSGGVPWLPIGPFGPTRWRPGRCARGFRPLGTSSPRR
jgi:hypothetical protein